MGKPLLRVPFVGRLDANNTDHTDMMLGLIALLLTTRGVSALVPFARLPTPSACSFGTRAAFPLAQPRSWLRAMRDRWSPPATQTSRGSSLDRSWLRAMRDRWSPP